MAIYDFALTPAEIAEHWRNAQAGKNYFGGTSSTTVRGAAWQSTRLLVAGEAMQFDSTTGLPLRKITVDYERFRQRSVSRTDL